MTTVLIYAAVIGGAALLAWYLGQRERRPCPRCGRAVVKGKLTCAHCGFDFNTIGSKP